MLCVFCEEGTEFLNIIYPNLRFESVKLHLYLITTPWNVEKKENKPHKCDLCIRHSWVVKSNVPAVLSSGKWAGNSSLRGGWIGHRAYLKAVRTEKSFLCRKSFSQKPGTWTSELIVQRSTEKKVSRWNANKRSGERYSIQGSEAVCSSRISLWIRTIMSGYLYLLYRRRRQYIHPWKLWKYTSLHDVTFYKMAMFLVLPWRLQTCWYMILLLF